MAAKKINPFKEGRPKHMAGTTKGKGKGLFIFLKAGQKLDVTPVVEIDKTIYAKFHEYWLKDEEGNGTVVQHPCMKRWGPCPSCDVNGHQPAEKFYLPVLTKEVDEEGKEEAVVRVLAGKKQLYTDIDTIYASRIARGKPGIKGWVIEVKREGSGRYDTKYSANAIGEAVDVSAYEESIPDFKKFLGPSDFDEITALLKENGLLEDVILSSELEDEELEEWEDTEEAEGWEEI